ncbi:hypothetical protein BS47DRAFT_245651 [Hydnum rufescens UP504]|uniref:Uncharacterized protein n=1 Tax=Hydnum rufescens UP504 TaxID=1448309 RepID=A0A9P6ANV0_9AGAM|nr:hypothetical protein BS47DRAFT_245651 [Hydnum rufescens UP504]
MHFLAPPQPDFDLKATIEMLKSTASGVLTASGRWLAFEKEPKDQPGAEDTVFKPMRTIFEEVVHAIIMNSNSKPSPADCSTGFLQSRSMVLRSSDRCDDTRSDGYVLLKDRLDAGAVS